MWINHDAEDRLLQYILTETFTRSALHRRISLLRAGIAAVFFIDPGKPIQTTIDAFIQKEKPNQNDSEFLRFCAVKFFSDFSRQTIQVLTSRLEDMANKIPVVTLSVPMEIPEVEAERVGQFVRRTFGKTVIVDFKVNPAIIGGCGMSWKGVYYDFSLPYYIKKNREKLITLINSYAKN